MGKIFSPSKPKAAKPIPVAAPIVIPTQDTAVTDVAKRKAAAIAQQRGGVASTTMSDTLGG